MGSGEGVPPPVAAPAPSSVGATRDAPPPVTTQDALSTPAGRRAATVKHQHQHKPKLKPKLVHQKTSSVAEYAKHRKMNVLEETAYLHEHECALGLSIPTPLPLGDESVSSPYR